MVLLDVEFLADRFVVSARMCRLLPPGPRGFWWSSWGAPVMSHFFVFCKFAYAVVDLILSEFILFGAHWPSWVCKMFFIKSGKFSVVITSNTPRRLFLSWDSRRARGSAWWCPQVSAAFTLPSFWPSHWIIPADLASDNSALPLSPSVNFKFQLLMLSSPEFLLGSLSWFISLPW